jgi:hypothetical protein
MKMVEALELCLKSVADRRSEMMMDDVGHGDIEAWISESTPIFLLSILMPIFRTSMSSLPKESLHA